MFSSVTFNFCLEKLFRLPTKQKQLKCYRFSLQFALDILKDIQIFQIQTEYQKLYHQYEIALSNGRGYWPEASRPIIPYWPELS